MPDENPDGVNKKKGSRITGNPNLNQLNYTSTGSVT